MRTLPTPPKPFESDGASGLISASYRRIYGKEIPWVECAIRHDWAYYFGGPHRLKVQADAALRNCVELYIKTLQHDELYFTKHPILSRLRLSAHKLASVVWLGVTVGGVWWLPYRGARWGYGYPYPQHGPQDPDYATPPITDEALHVHIRDEITGREV